MSTHALDRLIWLLIFGGLFLLGLGFAVARAAAPPASPLGYTLVSAGALAVAVGVVLIVVRSRLEPPHASAALKEEGTQDRP